MVQVLRPAGHACPGTPPFPLSALWLRQPVESAQSPHLFRVHPPTCQKKRPVQHAVTMTRVSARQFLEFQHQRGVILAGKVSQGTSADPQDGTRSADRQALGSQKSQCFSPFGRTGYFFSGIP